MGSLKCDLSHITVHTVNNHTHTLQGNSNARRQPSGSRYKYRLVCTCAQVRTHKHKHPTTFIHNHTRSMYVCTYRFASTSTLHKDIHTHLYNHSHVCTGLLERGNPCLSGEGSQTSPHTSFYQRKNEAESVDWALLNVPYGLAWHSCPLDRTNCVFLHLAEQISV